MQFVLSSSFVPFLPIFYSNRLSLSHPYPSLSITLFMQSILSSSYPPFFPIFYSQCSFLLLSSLSLSISFYYPIYAVYSFLFLRSLPSHFLFPLFVSSPFSAPPAPLPSPYPSLRLSPTLTTKSLNISLRGRTIRYRAPFSRLIM